MAGRKEFIGEGAFTAAAFAGAGALGAAGGEAGVGAGGGNEGERGEGLEAGGGGEGRGGRVARGRRSAGGNSHSHGRSDTCSSRMGGDYLVSAVAEWGADVFAAKVSDLLPLQAAAIKVCWIEGREVGVGQPRVVDVGVRIHEGRCARTFYQIRK